MLSEIGTDMTRWKTANHFVSWLGLCPGTKVSGGRVLSTDGRTNWQTTGRDRDRAQTGADCLQPVGEFRLIRERSSLATDCQRGGAGATPGRGAAWGRSGVERLDMGCQRLNRASHRAICLIWGHTAIGPRMGACHTPGVHCVIMSVVGGLGRAARG